MAVVTHRLLHNASGTARSAPRHGVTGSPAPPAMTQVGTATSPQPRATSSAHTAPQGFFVPAGVADGAVYFPQRVTLDGFQLEAFPLPPGRALAAPQQQGHGTHPVSCSGIHPYPNTLCKQTITQNWAEAFASVCARPGPFPATRTP